MMGRIALSRASSSTRSIWMIGFHSYICCGGSPPEPTARSGSKGLSLGNCITRLGAAERKCSSSRRGS
jgi:hypothetical protein